MVFYRGTAEVFEFPKTELLAAGALLMLARLLEREGTRARRRGVMTWIAGLPRRVASDARRDPIGASVGVFLVSALLSALVALRHDAAFFGAHESEAGVKTALATAAIYFASRALARDPRHLDRISLAAAMALAIALLYAALQILGLDPFPWTRSATIAGVRRVPGTLGHANHLGAFLAMMLPLLGRMALEASTRRARLVWVALAAASLPVLAATLSRGAWVAAAAGLLIFGFLAWRDRGRFRLPAVVATLAIAFLLPLLTPIRSELLLRFRQITDLRAPSTQSRVHLWRAGLEMARDHPALGVGTDNYLAAFPRYRSPQYWNIDWNGLSAKAHDEPIQIAATQGLVGLAAALSVVLFTLLGLLRLLRSTERPARRGAAAVLGALAAFAVQGLVGFTVASTGVLAAALAGWVAGSRGSSEPDAAVPHDRLARWLAWGTVAILAALFVVLPWIAETTAAPALRDSVPPEERANRLARAAEHTPWDARYPTELGRTWLGIAFTGTLPAERGPNLARARAAFERAAQLAPHDGEVHALIARTQAAQAAGDPDAAPLEEIRARFDRALALEPRNANVLELTAQGYLELGRTAEARAAALRCARLFPDFALPLADLGVAALLEGRPRDAADTLTLALKRNWHGEEAAAMAAKGNYVAALREMRLGDVLGGSSAPTPTRSSPTR